MFHLLTTTHLWAWISVLNLLCAQISSQDSPMKRDFDPVASVYKEKTFSPFLATRKLERWSQRKNNRRSGVMYLASHGVCIYFQHSDTFWRATMTPSTLRPAEKIQKRHFHSENKSNILCSLYVSGKKIENAAFVHRSFWICMVAQHSYRKITLRTRHTWIEGCFDVV